MKVYNIRIINEETGAIQARMTVDSDDLNRIYKQMDVMQAVIIDE